MERNFDQIIEQLLLAKDNVHTIVPPSKMVKTFTIGDGYLVGQKLQECHERRGFSVVGKKIGLTNRDIWKELNISAPMWAPIYNNTVVYAPKHSIHVPLSGLVAPRIEPEVVFKFKNAIEWNTPTSKLEQIFAQIEWVALGFEIVDCHYPNWEFTAADAVADHGLHAMLIVGDTRKLSEDEYGNFEAKLRKFTAYLKKNSNLVATGKGGNVLGSPLSSVQYILDLLGTQQWAKPIKAGDVITTGTMTPPQCIQSGDSWSVHPDGLDVKTLNIIFD